MTSLIAALLFAVGVLVAVVVYEVRLVRRQEREAAQREVEARERAAAREKARDTAAGMTDGQVLEWTSGVGRGR